MVMDYPFKYIQGDIHPTIKGFELCRWLATLIMPPESRRGFVPFSGTGSEVIGMLQAGWKEITGVELKKEYVLIQEARCKYWFNEYKKACYQTELEVQ